MIKISKDLSDLTEEEKKQVVHITELSHEQILELLDQAFVESPINATALMTVSGRLKKEVIELSEDTQSAINDIALRLSKLEEIVEVLIKTTLPNTKNTILN